MSSNLKKQKKQTNILQTVLHIFRDSFWSNKARAFSKISRVIGFACLTVLVTASVFFIPVDRFMSKESDTQVFTNV